MNEENGTLFRDKPVRFPKLPVQNQHSKKLIKLYFLNYIVLSQHTRNNRSNSMSNQLIIKKQGCWLGWLNFLLFHCWKSKLWILVFSLCHVLQLLPWKTSHPPNLCFIAKITMKPQQKVGLPLLWLCLRQVHVSWFLDWFHTSFPLHSLLNVK